MTGAAAKMAVARALARVGQSAAWLLATCMIAVWATYLATLPADARPLSKCRLGNQSEYGSVSDGTITDEKRKELRLRVLVDALDDVDIVFRGRLISRRYLSDIYQTYVPLILEVYDSAVVLKGSLPATAKDGKVFLIREKTCDGGCRLKSFPEVADGTDESERVVLALNNTLENPAEGRDRWTNQVVYRGRIDALLGPCDPYLINDAAAAALVVAPQEMERLRHAYPPRTAEDKRRDEQVIINKFMYRPAPRDK